MNEDLKNLLPELNDMPTVSREKPPKSVVGRGRPTSWRRELSEKPKRAKRSASERRAKRRERRLPIDPHCPLCGELKESSRQWVVLAWEITYRLVVCRVCVWSIGGYAAALLVAVAKGFLTEEQAREATAKFKKRVNK